MIAKVSASLALIGMLSGGVYLLEDRYAKAARLKLIEQRLDYKILNDRIYQLMQRLWAFEDRYGKNCETAPREIKQECRELQHAIGQAKERLRDKTS